MPCRPADLEKRLPPAEGRKGRAGIGGRLLSDRQGTQSRAPRSLGRTALPLALPDSRPVAARPPLLDLRTTAAALHAGHDQGPRRPLRSRRAAYGRDAHRRRRPLRHVHQARPARTRGGTDRRRHRGHTSPGTARGPTLSADTIVLLRASTREQLILAEEIGDLARERNGRALALLGIPRSHRTRHKKRCEPSFLTCCCVTCSSAARNRSRRPLRPPRAERASRQPSCTSRATATESAGRDRPEGRSARGRARARGGRAAHDGLVRSREPEGTIARLVTTPALEGSSVVEPAARHHPRQAVAGSAVSRRRNPERRRPYARRGIRSALYPWRPMRS